MVVTNLNRRHHSLLAPRACLHWGGGPQVGEVAHLAVVQKWPAFTSKLTTPGHRGDVSRRCCVVARHVNRENGMRTTHFGGQCSFPLIICSRCNISVLWLFIVTFDDTKPPPKAVNCNMNSSPARRVTPPRVVYTAKCDPGWQGNPTWQTGQPA